MATSDDSTGSPLTDRDISWYLHPALPPLETTMTDDQTDSGQLRADVVQLERETLSLRADIEAYRALCSAALDEITRLTLVIAQLKQQLKRRGSPQSAKS